MGLNELEESICEGMYLDGLRGDEETYTVDSTRPAPYNFPVRTMDIFRRRVQEAPQRLVRPVAPPVRREILAAGGGSYVPPPPVEYDEEKVKKDIDRIEGNIGAKFDRARESLTYKDYVSAVGDIKRIRAALKAMMDRIPDKQSMAYYMLADKLREYDGAEERLKREIDSEKTRQKSKTEALIKSGRAYKLPWEKQKAREVSSYEDAEKLHREFDAIQQSVKDPTVKKEYGLLKSKVIHRAGEKYADDVWRMFKRVADDFAITGQPFRLSAYLEEIKSKLVHDGQNEFERAVGVMVANNLTTEVINNYLPKAKENYNRKLRKVKEQMPSQEWHRYPDPVSVSPKEMFREMPSPFEQGARMPEATVETRDPLTEVVNKVIYEVGEALSNTVIGIKSLQDEPEKKQETFDLRTIFGG